MDVTIVRFTVCILFILVCFVTYMLLKCFTSGRNTEESSPHNSTDTGRNIPSIVDDGTDGPATNCIPDNPTEIGPRRTSLWVYLNETAV